MSLTKMSTHILVIPGSWPSSNYPLSCSFIKNDVEALAHHSSDLHFSVLYTGDSDYGVSFSQPLAFLATLFRSMLDRKTTCSGKIRVYIRPVLYVYKFGREYYLKKRIKTALKILSKIEQSHGPIHLIHAHFSHAAGDIAENLSKKLGVPYIITEHAGPFPLDPKLEENSTLVEKYFKTLSGAKRIICVSPFLKNTLERYGLKNLICIPNQVDEKKFYVVKHKRSDHFIFLAMSSLTYMKGIDVLLKGFSQFIQKTSFTHVSLKIVGDGPDANAFLELVKALDLQNFVTFLGAQPFERVNKFYQEAHCFVHASRHESFSLVCAEAQASGLPVITTKCGGPESIVTQSYLGIVVENENHHAFANAMWEVYENYHSYDANTIREHFIQKFSRPIVSKKILQLYSDVIRA